MKTNPNDPAFTGPTAGGFTSGLTKLEYFAGLAMQSIISNCSDRNYTATIVDNAHELGLSDSEFIGLLSTSYAKGLIKTLNDQKDES